MLLRAAEDQLLVSVNRESSGEGAATVRDQPAPSSGDDTLRTRQNGAVVHLQSVSFVLPSR